MDKATPETVSASTADASEPAASRSKAAEEFAEFFKHQLRAVTGFAVAIGVPPQQAEDVVNEAMLQVLRHWDGVGSPRAWVRKAVANIYRTQLRKDGNRAVAEARFVQERLRTGEADHTMTSLEDLQWVEQTIEQLPPRQREVFRCVMDGLETAEICAVLGIQPANVRQNLLHARRRLRAYLAPQNTSQTTADHTLPGPREEDTK